MEQREVSSKASVLRMNKVHPSRPLLPDLPRFPNGIKSPPLRRTTAIFAKGPIKGLLFLFNNGVFGKRKLLYKFAGPPPPLMFNFYGLGQIFYGCMLQTIAGMVDAIPR